MNQPNPFLYWTDSYKVSHINFETEGVHAIYSNFTPRFAHYMRELAGDVFDDKYVVFGVQFMLKLMHERAADGFFKRNKEEVIEEMKTIHGAYIGNTRFDQFEALHDLGYLPIEVRALSEGSVVDVGVPFLTIENTHPDFEWLPNFLETGISMELWKPLTVATIGRLYRLISNKYALETTGSIAGTEWQNHDFGARGQSGFESCSINGAAFLLSSCGTDNIPSLWAANKYYNSKVTDGLLAASIPAGEHSVTTLGILAEVERSEVTISKPEAERRYLQMLMEERFPTGMLAYVADSYDYWGMITDVIPSLKDTIMARDGKLVVRGDSGDPVYVIAGYDIYDMDIIPAGGKRTESEWYDTIEAAMSDQYDWTEGEIAMPFVVKFKGEYFKMDGWLDDEDYQYHISTNTLISEAEAKGTIESLWDTFGGKVNALGFKELDPHIGMIYGDGITLQRSQEILGRLKHKGFASTNIVFGVGSYSLNMLSRDHLGMAIKATSSKINMNGEVVEMAIYKDPKTDTSKKSAKGLIKVVKDANGKYSYEDNQSRADLLDSELKTVYDDGVMLTDETIFSIRETLWGIVKE